MRRMSLVILDYCMTFVPADILEILQLTKWTVKALPKDKNAHFHQHILYSDCYETLSMSVQILMKNHLKS